MKPKIFLLLSFLLVLIVFLIVNNVRRSRVKPSGRHSGIPAKALWVGGVDGGNWYLVTRVFSDNTFAIKIFSENNGELEADTSFILSSECPLTQLDSLTLIQNMDGYDGSKILLNLPEKGNKCFLMPGSHHESSTNLLLNYEILVNGQDR